MSPSRRSILSTLTRGAAPTLVCLALGLFLGTGAAMAGFTETRESVQARLLVLSPADVNLDTRVDGADLALVGRNLGAPVPVADPRRAFGLGDVNLDGNVGVVDLVLVAVDAEG